MTAAIPHGVRRVDQGLAVAAAAAVPAQVSDEVLTRLRSLPAMLQTAGLAATLAFLIAKSGADPVGVAYLQVRAAMTRRIAMTLGIAPAPSSPDLLTRLGGVDVANYQRASRDALAFAGWLKRIAEGRPSA